MKRTALAALLLTSLTACGGGSGTVSTVNDLAPVLGCTGFADASPSDSACTINGETVRLVTIGAKAGDPAVEASKSAGMHWASNGKVSIYATDAALVAELAAKFSASVIS